eukprot:GDKK01054067.1.p2 GENE.GDKK01054067.1~~GDKK01054067.1.p2  ORF type:complete len:112 (+),score=2.72 GDKK01054067.1:594-929(+)
MIPFANGEAKGYGREIGKQQPTSASGRIETLTFAWGLILEGVADARFQIIPKTLQRIVASAAQETTRFGPVLTGTTLVEFAVKNINWRPTSGKWQRSQSTVENQKQKVSLT